jgi:multidrug efflux pump subunit AcrB
VRQAGAPLRRATVESTVRRARPVVLAAVLAFVPLTLSVFRGPMAVAMIGGPTLATLATLLVVPALHGLALPARRRRRAEARPGHGAAAAAPVAAE